jgi:hypothetical protein
VARDDQGSGLWSTLLAAAGAAGATVAIVYLVGGASLSLRYEGFGLPGQYTAAQTPRETLLAAGVRTLLAWILAGAVLVLAVRWLAKRFAPPRGAAVVAWAAVGLVVLLLVLKVWWPVAVYAGVLAMVFVESRWPANRTVRTLVAVLVVVVVAVAYEADRITYYVEWTCVTRADHARVCGVLVGQQDRGFYLGVPGGAAAPVEEAGKYHLAFVPAELVRGAKSGKRKAHAIATRADARRERLISRFDGIRIR